MLTVLIFVALMSNWFIKEKLWIIALLWHFPAQMGNGSKKALQEAQLETNSSERSSRLLNNWLILLT